MKKGTRVKFSWTTAQAGWAPGVGAPDLDFPAPTAITTHYGTGVTVSDEEDGRVLVAQDPAGEDPRHHVIWCTVTWLTPE